MNGTIKVLCYKSRALGNGEPNIKCDTEIYMETERLLLHSWKYGKREPLAEMNDNRNVMKYFPKTLSVDESNAFVDRINVEF